MQREEIEALLEQVRLEEAEVSQNIARQLSELQSSSTLRSHKDALSSHEPAIEAAVQTCHRIQEQISSCAALSDHLSGFVRSLNSIQTRVNDSLQVTENILNLGVLRQKLVTAVAAGELATAVGCLKKVLSLEVEETSDSDDWNMIRSSEEKLKKDVWIEFETAMEAKKLDLVVELCPLFSVLGLEAKARDLFLDFLDVQVFSTLRQEVPSSLDSDASLPPSGTETVSATSTYAQALSTVFNSAYTVIQQYLPMVITGLEASWGDVHFLRRLHTVVTEETRRIITSYLSFRNVSEKWSTVEQELNSASSSAGMAVAMMSSLSEFAAAKQSAIGGSSVTTSSETLTESEMHVLLDELAVLLQYTSRYSSFLRQVCAGAESKIRPTAVLSEEELASTKGGRVVVFPNPSTEFHKLVEKVAHLYLQGEQWVLRRISPRISHVHKPVPNWHPPSANSAVANVIGGVTSATNAPSLPNAGPAQTVSHLNTTGAVESVLTHTADVEATLDECFFVLQKCGLRAVATQNLTVTVAVFRAAAEVLEKDLLGPAVSAATTASSVITTAMSEHIQAYLRGVRANLLGSSTSGGATGSVTRAGSAAAAVFSNAVALASTLTSGHSRGSATGGVTFLADGTFVIATEGGNISGVGLEESEDRWGVLSASDALSRVDESVRYTRRLAEGLVHAAMQSFEEEERLATSAPTVPTVNDTSVQSNSTSAPRSKVAAVNKLKTPFERLQQAHSAFQTPSSSAEKALSDVVCSIISTLRSITEHILSETLRDVTSGSSVSGGMGINFALPDESFDSQPAVALLPRLVICPLDTAIAMVLSCLSSMPTQHAEFLKSLPMSVCEPFERLILRTNFRLAGALKFEEICRAIFSLLGRHSEGSVRGQVARLREMLSALTADGDYITTLDLHHLASTERDAVLACRLDRSVPAE